ncbi:hypothetical protein BGX27_006106 [Mortierella sp. AM989]|nr:hypothetical protein BGX27_006106 [Mortierella sp. AM989]
MHLHGKPRPFFKARDGTIKIHRTLPEHLPCTVCGTTRTPVWSKDLNNEMVCFGCNLVSKHDPTKSRTRPGAKGDVFVDARKSRGISKKKKAAVPKHTSLLASGASSRFPDHVAFSDPVCEPESESFGVYSVVGWHRDYQQQHHQPQYRSHNAHQSFSSSHTGDSNGDGTLGGCYWGSQEIGQQQSHQSQYQQPQYHHQVYQNSYQGPEVGDSSGSYSPNTLCKDYTPSSIFPDSSTLPPIMVHTKTHAPAVSPSAIPSEFPLSNTPSYMPESPQEFKGEFMSSDDQATEQLQQQLMLTPSSALNALSSPPLLQGELLDNIKREDEESRSIETPSTTGSELTPVADFDSD